jgi:hypothetical protein
MRTFAIYRLRMTVDQFWQMTPRELSGVICWHEDERDFHIALAGRLPKLPQ